MSNFFRLKNDRIVVSAEAPAGIYNSTQLKKIADLCAQDLAIVKATEDQRISLFVKEEDLDSVQLVLDAAGLSLRHYQDGIHQAVACIGEMCPHSEQDAVAAAIAVTEACAGKQCDKSIKIGINGCSKGCVPSHSFDIDILGEGEGYRLSLGGKNSHMPELAAFMAEHIPENELADLVGKVIDLYNDKKEGDESLHDLLDRCGTSEFASVLAPYSQDAACFDSLNIESQLPADEIDTQKTTEESNMAEPVDEDLDFDFSDSLNGNPDVGEISPIQHLQKSSAEESRVDLVNDLSPTFIPENESMEISSSDSIDESDIENPQAAEQSSVSLKEEEEPSDELMEPLAGQKDESEDPESQNFENSNIQQNETNSEVVMADTPETKLEENIESIEEVDNVGDETIENDQVTESASEADDEVVAIDQGHDDEVEMSAITEGDALEIDDESNQEDFEEEFNESVEREVEINDSSLDYDRNDAEIDKAVSAMSDSHDEPENTSTKHPSVTTLERNKSHSNVSSMFKVSGFGFNDNGDFHLSFASGAFIDIDVSSLDNGEQREISLGTQSFAVTKGNDGLTVEIDGLKLFCPFESIQSAS